MIAVTIVSLKIASEIRGIAPETNWVTLVDLHSTCSALYTCTQPATITQL